MSGGNKISKIFCLYKKKFCDHSKFKTDLFQEDSVYRIPKCCPLGQSYVESSPVCQKSSTYSPLDIQLFESNETGLDPDLKYNSSNFTLIPYYRNLKCGSNDLM